MSNSKNNLPLEVITEAQQLLNNESSWNKKSVYGEPCTHESKTYTLGCALELAQIKIRGKAIPRAKEMNKVRRRILRHFFFRGHLHPITYFNRNKRTTYEDVMFVLDEAIKKLSK